MSREQRMRSNRGRAGRHVSWRCSEGRVNGQSCPAPTRRTVTCITECRLASAESQARALPRLFRLDLAVARRPRGVQRDQELSRSVGDLGHGTDERGLIGLRRLVEAGQFADELQRRGVNLVLRGRRLEVEQRLDVVAHEDLPCLSLTGRSLKDDRLLQNTTSWSSLAP